MRLYLILRSCRLITLIKLASILKRPSNFMIILKILRGILVIQANILKSWSDNLNLEKQDQSSSNTSKTILISLRQTLLMSFHIFISIMSKFWANCINSAFFGMFLWTILSHYWTLQTINKMLNAKPAFYMLHR